MAESTTEQVSSDTSPDPQSFVVDNPPSLGNVQSGDVDALDRIMHSRRSVRVYDPDKTWDPDAVARSIERAVLAPNSSNLQTWEFHRITSEEMLRKAVPLCMGQNAAKTARELVAVVVRTDKWKDRRDWLMQDYNSRKADEPERRKKLIYRYYNQWIPMVYRTDPFRIFSTIKRIALAAIGLTRPVYRTGSHTDVRIIGHKSAGIAAGYFMLSMKAEGFDTCPMEGFDSVKMKRLLGLSGRAEICMMIGCGPGHAEKGIYDQRTRVPMTDVIVNH